MKIFTEEVQVRSYLREAILSRFDTLAAYARWESEQREKRFTSQRLSNVLAGDKNIPEFMLKRWKIKHVVSEVWEVKQ